MDQPLTFDDSVLHGNYVVCVTPLDMDADGSDEHSVAGILFSIYKRKSSTLWTFVRLYRTRLLRATRCLARQLRSTTPWVTACTPPLMAIKICTWKIGHESHANLSSELMKQFSRLKRSRKERTEKNKADGITPVLDFVITIPEGDVPRIRNISNEGRETSKKIAKFVKNAAKVSNDLKSDEPIITDEIAFRRTGAKCHEVKKISSVHLI